MNLRQIELTVGSNADGWGPSAILERGLAGSDLLCPTVFRPFERLPGIAQQTNNKTVWVPAADWQQMLALRARQRAQEGAGGAELDDEDEEFEMVVGVAAKPEKTQKLFNYRNRNNLNKITKFVKLRSAEDRLEALKMQQDSKTKRSLMKEVNKQLKLQKRFIRLRR